MNNGIFVGVVFTLILSLCTATVFGINEKSGSFFKLFLVSIIIYANFFIHSEFHTKFYYFLPWISLVLIFLVSKIEKQYKKYFLFAWIVFTLFLALFYVKMLVFPITFDVNRTVFSDHNIKSFAGIHFGETGSTILRLKLLFFESYLYLFSMLRRLFEYFTFWNLSSMFGLGGLLTLVMGIKEIVTKKDNWILVPFISNFALLAFILMISRSIDERGVWVIISPILVYVALIGSKKLSLPVILFLQLVWLLFIRTYV